uniref:Uncharacterized protein n=1 Tax=Anguilla anguilla TaxID=7936 RepID=A0A0E9PQE5_ANGAN
MLEICLCLHGIQEVLHCQLDHWFDLLQLDNVGMKASVWGSCCLLCCGENS